MIANDEQAETSACAHASAALRTAARVTAAAVAQYCTAHLNRACVQVQLLPLPMLLQHTAIIQTYA
jgi:hypothetical protein